MNWQQLRVLIVEDVYLQAVDLADRVRAAGMVVVGIAATLAAAKIMAAEQQPHVAIVDLDLGDGPSWEALNALRLAGIRCLCITGHGGTLPPCPWPDTRVILKPVDGRALIDMLKKLAA